MTCARKVGPCAVSQGMQVPAALVDVGMAVDKFQQPLSFKLGGQTEVELD